MASRALGSGDVGQVDGHAEVVHTADDLDAEVAEAAGVALVHAVADVVAAVVGDAGEADAHAEELVEPLDAVADGQVLEGGKEADFALLLGGLDVGGVADAGDVVLHRHVGDHVADFSGDVIVFDEGHIAGALETAEDVGGGDGGPAAGANGVVAPLVAANAN